ncbi:MAG: phytanoyl-CoA dioxygenase family protein [Planctomycetaceae bacterium]|nr:phytanoyl-CoA dioxygenase family protein [Planctomycetaceae bacterium]
MTTAWHHEIQEFGFAILPHIFSANEVDELVVGLETALHRADEAEGPIRDKAGTVYAGRNLLRLFEPAKTIWRRSPLLEFLRNVLGPDVGLVRVLFFDKPPERTWALPWHKDLTIAVKPHSSASTVFSKPTLKVGVPHVEASREVLEAMLTLRIHLDEMTDENGPLQVVPGSHRLGKVPVASYETARAILGSRGDVLAMRPMLAHRSISSHEGTTLHRRILHLEFTGLPHLPDGFEWHDFVAA